jgi:hypothetical protein
MKTERNKRRKGRNGTKDERTKEENKNRHGRKVGQRRQNKTECNKAKVTVLWVMTPCIFVVICIRVSEECDVSIVGMKEVLY